MKYKKSDRIISPYGIMGNPHRKHEVRLVRRNGFKLTIYGPVICHTENRTDTTSIKSKREKLGKNGRQSEQIT